MGEAIGGMLSSAVGVAISPLPLIALILMLASPRGRANGIAFTLGWMITLAVVGSLMLLIDIAAHARGEDGPAAWVTWLELGLGVLFAALAVQQWRSRPRPGQPATTPAWMASLDSMTPGKAFRLAALLSGANPMNLPLTVGAAAIIGGATGSTGARVVALILFVLIASSSLLGTLGAYLLGGDRAAAALEGLKVWMTAHGAAVMTTVLALLAVTYIGDAIGALR
ncbi:GAP family protein [Streptomyces sp. NPDC046942]|uniref:GAP family protein n=1 Tax=Streptomyces sp. NPDC046942 TaxID=3155137 RepID=UPI0033BFF3FF